MPLINGACIPPICLKRRLFAIGAKVLQTIEVGGVVMQNAKDVTNNPLYAPLLPQGLAALRAAANVDCDGCVCFAIAKFNPPVRAPASNIVQVNQSVDAAGVKTIYTYEVTARWDILQLGLCLPPKAKIQIGDEWVPVEEAPQNPKEYKPKYPESPGGGGGGKKGKKKKGTKKRKAVTPRRKKAPAKKKSQRRR